jgi:hypothetical protein
MKRTCAVLAVLSLAAGSVAHADPRPELVRAHQEKVGGAVLIGVGSALTLAGQIMFIVSAAIPYVSHAHCGPAGCGASPFLNPTLVPEASAAVGVGGALVIIGVPFYITGGRRAERATLAFSPQLGPNSASLSARLRF